MKSISTLLLINLLLLFISPVYSDESISSWEKIRTRIINSSEKEQIYIDNMYIQTYKSKPGIWKKFPYGVDIKSMISSYGAKEDDFVAMNELPLKTKKIFNPQWLFIPFSDEYLIGLKENGISRITWESSKDELIWPVEGVRITSRLGKRWGKFHPGLDIAASSGTMVLAAMDGEVTESKFMGDYGNMVIIGHTDVYVSLYAHLSENFVKKGDKIRKGQVLGLSGSSGRSTGPHLHFEVRYLNVILNPEVFLPAFKESIYALVKEEEPTIQDQ
jgi:murein DD-endopeptidase MepM/ murein hydrolase activator NlpD